MWHQKQKRNSNEQDSDKQISTESKYEFSVNNSNDSNTNRNTNKIRYFNGSKPAYYLGAGDSYYIPSFLDHKISDSTFISLINGDEIKWYQTYIYQNNTMIPQKRLSNTQIQINNNNNNNIIPLYRYPTNNLQSMPIIGGYTKSIKPITKRVENKLCQPINHAVIAIYRNGNDYIGFHSDKMLDIKNNSKIASISLGTKRKFILKELGEYGGNGGNKEDHIILHHGSLIVIGPETNKYFRHSIKKNYNIKTPRISLSLRYIGTFWNKNNKNKNNIFGQGSEYQTLNYPLKPFNHHNINHKIHIVNYKYNELNKFNLSLHCNPSYKYHDIDDDQFLIKYKIMENCYTLKDSHFRCILFENINNKSVGYEILKYLKTKKYGNCIHIPFAMIMNDKIYEYNNDNEPKRAKIGEYLLNVLVENNKNKNVMIVVIRHWLGTLLGINNLYNCYQIISQSLFKQIKQNDDDQNIDWKQKYFLLKQEYDKLKLENIKLKSQINSNK